MKLVKNPATGGSTGRSFFYKILFPGDSSLSGTVLSRDDVFYFSQHSQATILSEGFVRRTDPSLVAEEKGTLTSIGVADWTFAPCP